jgi:hypothetical protein
MTHYLDKIAEINERSAFALSADADCGLPDSPESAGAAFLSSVRDGVLGAVEGDAYGITRDGRAELERTMEDRRREIADAAPDACTHTRWQEFVDLQAYREEPEFGDWSDDLTDIASEALYQIADRLVGALLSELGDALDEDENDDDDN